MKFKGIGPLCTPAYVYLVISIIALIVMFLQNFGNREVYCLGSYSCDVSNVAIIFIVKILYVLLWTWILNLICGAGAEGLAWFLVLLPFLIFFILLSLLMI
jgi:hypothetical protein|uniref:Transmembrane protein n=1 Tax=viral metagenome TaxID=1070528 RepID=A0A6C0ICF9_9ZZZZ